MSNPAHFVCPVALGRAHVVAPAGGELARFVCPAALGRARCRRMLFSAPRARACSISCGAAGRCLNCTTSSASCCSRGCSRCRPRLRRTAEAALRLRPPPSSRRRTRASRGSTARGCGASCATRASAYALFFSLSLSLSLSLLRARTHTHTHKSFRWAEEESCRDRASSFGTSVLPAKRDVRS